MSGNFLVLYIFSTTKQLRTPANLFIINLAFTDFFMMFIQSPPMIVNCYYQTWMLGPLMCDVYALTGSLFGCSSILTMMMMISFERYNVIVKGLQARPLTVTGALLKIFFIWLFAAFWAVMPLFGWNRYVPEGNMTSCGTDYLDHDWFSRSYIIFYSVFVFWMPLLLIIHSYYHILKTVMAHEKTMREQAKKMNVASLRSSEADDTKMEFKLAKVALITIALWFMAWSPYTVINYNGIFNGSLSPLATVWGSVFAKASAVYNPLVYAISHPKYREALHKKFPDYFGSDSVRGKQQQADDAASYNTTLSATENSSL